MKITIVGPVYPYRGGIAHFTSLLAQKLIEAGHNVQMVSYKKQYPQWLYPGESDKDYSQGRKKIDAEYLLTLLNPLSWNKVVNSIKDFQPQKVIFPWWVTIWGPAVHHIISRLKRNAIQSIILIHNTIPHESSSLDRFLARWALKKADGYIVMTEKEKGRLLDLMPSISNIDIVPLPISRVFKPSGINKNLLRSKFGIPAKEPVMLFFGFVRPYKGLDDLLEAQKILITKGLQTRLVIAGEFWENFNKYEQKISALGLTNYVNIFNEYIPDDEAAQFFEMSDIFVAPYIGGTQSGVIKAALGFGLPIVLTDVIVDEIIMNFPDLCKIVPHNDPRSLSKGIQEQLKRKPLNEGQIETIFCQTWQRLVESICNYDSGSS